MHFPLRPFFLCALAAALLAVVPARAQQDSTDAAPRPGDPALPEIAPREVEIRGQLDISLPALRRPALAGLLPATRLQPLPPAPLPTLETVDPPTNAPPALADQATTPSGFDDLPPPERGLLEAGGGRYLSRFARARFDFAIAPQWAVRSRLDYTGTDGFIPFDGMDVETPADELSGSATLRTERPGVTAALTTGGFFGQHQLYGAVPPGSDFAAPGRDRYGGNAALQVQAGGGEGLTLEARARLNAAQVTTDALGAGIVAPSELSEQRAGGVARVGAPVGTLRLEADARGSTARLSRSVEADAHVSFADAGAGAWVVRDGPLRVFGGARVLAPSGSGPFFAPDVRLTWQATPRLGLYARTDPGVEVNLMAARYRENPSLLYEDAPQPNVFTLDAEGGARFFPLPALEVRAFAGYRRAPSFRFYEEVRTPSNTRGVTAVRYDRARILHTGGTLSLRRAGRLHASLSVAYRNGRLENGLRIPYFSPFTAEALFSAGFLDGRGRVEVTGAFESARPLTPYAQDEVAPFADLDVEGRYALTPTVGLTLGIRNIPAGALERFDRYPRPPLVVESGLRLRL